MRRSRKIIMRLLPEEALERMAFVLGSYSASGSALTELRARRAAGEDVHAFQTNQSMIVVGPMPEGMAP